MAGPIRISVLANTSVAQRDVKRFAEQVEESVDDATDSLDRGTGRAERGARGLVGRMVSGMSALGPAIMPILGTVAVAGGGLLGAGIAAAAVAAIPLALGGGVLAAGIFAAAKDPAVGAAFAPLKDQAGKVLAKFAEPFKGPLIRAATTFSNALAKATPFLVQMGQAVAPIIDQLAPALADMAVSALPGILAAVKASVPLFTGLISVLPNVGIGISAVLTGIVALLPYAKAIGLVLFGVGKFVADVLIPPLRILAGQYLRAVRDAVASVTASFKANEPQLRVFVGWVKQASIWVGTHLAPILGGQLVGSLRGAALAVRLIIGAVSAVVTAVQVGTRKLSDLISWVRGIPGQVRGALGNLGGVLTGAGRSVIDGFIRGIRAGFDRVRSTLGSLTSLLPDWKGPARRDKDLLTRNGELVIGGFLSGLESRYGAVRGSLGRFTSSLASAVDTGPAATGFASTTGAAAATTAPAEITLTFERSGDPLIDVLLDMLRDRIRVKGGNVQAVLGRG